MAGPAGAPGAPGAQGPPGAPGAPGLSEAHEAFFFDPANPIEITGTTSQTATTLVTLDLAAGGWMLTAQVDGRRESGNGILYCITRVAPGWAATFSRIDLGGNAGSVLEATQTASGLYEYGPGGGTAELACYAHPSSTGPNPKVFLASLVATAVKNVTVEEQG